MLTLLVVLTLIQPFYGETQCSQAFECVGQTRTDADEMYGDGYKSNYGSLSSISSDITVECRGAFSCSISSISGIKISCRGSNSCFQASITTKNGATTLYGKGVNALAYAQISQPTPYDYDLNCYSEQSCAYAVINDAININGYGAFSLLNTIIESTNIAETLDITLYGYYAGFGATITCKTGHICNINCHYNACVNLKLFCENNNCNINTNSIDTIVTTDESLNTESILLYDSIHIAEREDTKCLNSTQSFDDYRERYVESYIVCDAMTEAICCRGHQSCHTVNSIDCTSLVASIVCSGDSSCYNSNINNNGAIFCGGSEACFDGDITTIGSVYCYGSQSCARGVINGASDIYCSGYRACFSSSITSNGADINIYLLGYWSGMASTVKCNLGDVCSIMCYAFESCRSLVLICDGECTVYCNEDSICPTDWTATPTMHPIDSVPNPTTAPFILTKEPQISKPPTYIPSQAPFDHLSLQTSTLPSIHTSSNISPIPSSIMTVTESITTYQTIKDTSNVNYNNEDHMFVLLIAGIIASFCVCCLCVLIIWKWFTQKRWDPEPHNTGGGSDRKQANVAPYLDDDDDEIDPQDLEIELSGIQMNRVCSNSIGDVMTVEGPQNGVMNQKEPKDANEGQHYAVNATIMNHKELNDTNEGQNYDKTTSTSTKMTK